MLGSGFRDEDVRRVLWENPVSFYGQSGRLELERPQPDAVAGPGNNSIKRGGE
jgi:hypothetical protein